MAFNEDIVKPKILIAEDHKVTMALYRQGLPENLCDIKLVSDGEQALSVYKQWHPDIIVLDHNMPILNGYQVLKAIRESEKDITTSIIMVTSESDKGNIIACAKFGIQGYIVKPFRSNEIAKKIFQFHNTFKQKK